MFKLCLDSLENTAWWFHIRMFMIVLCFNSMQGKHTHHFERTGSMMDLSPTHHVKQWLSEAIRYYLILFLFSFFQNVCPQRTGEELGNFGDGICGGNRWQRPSHHKMFFWKVQQCRSVFRSVFQTSASDSAPGCLPGPAFLVFLVWLQASMAAMTCRYQGAWYAADRHHPWVSGGAALSLGLLIASLE